MKHLTKKLKKEAEQSKVVIREVTETRLSRNRMMAHKKKPTNWKNPQDGSNEDLQPSTPQEPFEPVPY